MTERRMRIRRRALLAAIAAVALLLITAAGIALRRVEQVDGLVYIGPANEVTQEDEFTLVIRGSEAGACIQVQSDAGMSGGCGADFSEAVGVGIGGIRGQNFADGWVPPETALLELTFEDGETYEVTEFVSVDGFDVRFFLFLLADSGGAEPSFPVSSVAYDADGNFIAQFELPECPPDHEPEDC